MTEPMIHRTFTAALERTGADERTLGGLAVPYNRPATVSDDGVTSYREMIAPGAFRHHLNAFHRIVLKYRHGQGILDTLGTTTQLDDQPDGLHAMFRVFANDVGNQALTLVDEGLLPGLSISGIPIRQHRTADGTVVRTKVDLREISLCEEPAYTEALVTVRRTRHELQLPEPPSDDQLARLEAIGIRVSR